MYLRGVRQRGGGRVLAAVAENMVDVRKPGGLTMNEPAGGSEALRTTSRRVKVEGDLYHGRIPNGAVYVGWAAPGLPASPYRTPYPVQVHGRQAALHLFRRHLAEHPELVEAARRELTGRDLACWCRPDDPCHAEVWLEVLAAAPYGAAAATSAIMGQVTTVTLAEWAAKLGRSEKSVRNFWRPLPGFPAPVGRRRAAAAHGPGPEEYDEAELDAWRAQWEAQRERPAPAPYEVPGDPEEYRTLGAIARLLGVDGKTISQYRGRLDERAAHQDRGTRRLYRTGDVIEVLNSRRGVGVAADPAADRRRRTADER
jgi:hypothetical protein